MHARVAAFNLAVGTSTKTLGLTWVQADNNALTGQGLAHVKNVFLSFTAVADRIHKFPDQMDAQSPDRLGFQRQRSVGFRNFEGIEGFAVVLNIDADRAVIKPKADDNLMRLRIPVSVAKNIRKMLFERKINRL